MDKATVKKSKIKGRGLFAGMDIRKNKIIGVIEGPIVPDNEESYRKYGADHLHPISYTEAILVRNFTKFTNHSCEPNCGLRDGVHLVAMKDIKDGDEITLDYDTLEYDWEMDCNCGSPDCRKIIRGYKYLSNGLKRKYKGFTAPYLLKKY